MITFHQFVMLMEPEFKLAPFHKYIIELCQTEVVDKDSGRATLSVPPAHGKSTLVSKLLPAYLLGVNPNNRIIICSYSNPAAKQFGRDVRKYLQTPEYKTLFPTTKIVGNGRGGDFELEKDGTEPGGLKCLGRRAGITSFRADYIILDDCIEGITEASNDRLLNQIWDWFTTDVSTRLTKTGSIIAINTRWSAKDAIGRMKELFPNWTHVNLKAISEDGDVLGRPPGKPLWGESFNLEMLEERRHLNTVLFELLYQGSPESNHINPIKLQTIYEAINE